MGRGDVMKFQNVSARQCRSITTNHFVSSAMEKVASDAEKEAWNYIIKWLTRLRLLDGVPFPYIVPTDGMLPNESIRFFHLDRNWLDALVDGALSTGVLDSRGSLADESAEKRQMLYNELMEELNEKEIVHEPYRAGLFAFDKLLATDASMVQSVLNGVAKDTQDDIKMFTTLKQQEKDIANVQRAAPQKATKSRDVPRIMSEEKQNLIVNNPELATKVIALENLKGQIGNMIAQIPFVTGGSLTGFLLRSSVVRDFPGIEVQAFEAPGFIGNNRSKAYNAQYRVELLKVKRLSSSIIMYIFNGLPTHLRIKEPSEGLRLGLEKNEEESASFYMKFKDEFGVQLNQNDEEYKPNDPMKVIDLPTRYTTGDGSVINFAGHLASYNFKGDAEEGLEYGGFLATQLMQFPYEQDFEYDAIDQVTMSEKVARVNTDKIVLGDSSDVTFDRDPYGDD